MSPGPATTSPSSAGPPGSARAAPARPRPPRAASGAPARVVAQHREQPSADLAVGAGVGLRLPRRPVVRRSPAGVPGAPVAERAGRAPRGRGRAHQGAELHHADRPGRRGRRVVRQQPGGQVALGPGDRRTGQLLAGEARGRAPAARWCRARRAAGRRRTTPPRRRCSRRLRAAPAAAARSSGTSPAVPLGDRDRRGVEAQRPARVAEPSPGPHRLARRRRRPGRRVSASCSIHASPHRQHPRDRRLLEHELRDEDPPRRRADGRARAGRGRARRTTAARARARREGPWARSDYGRRPMWSAGGVPAPRLPGPSLPWAGDCPDPTPRTPAAAGLLDAPGPRRSVVALVLVLGISRLLQHGRVGGPAADRGHRRRLADGLGGRHRRPRLRPRTPRRSRSGSTRSNRCRSPTDRATRRTSW